jgi:hypothetical protein
VYLEKNVISNMYGTKDISSFDCECGYSQEGKYGVCKRGHNVGNY